MALVNVTLKPRESGAGDQVDDNLKNPRSEATRVFTLLSDSVNDNELTIKYAAQAAGLLPRRGEAHPSNFYLRCVNVDIRRTSLIYYEATASYTSIGGGDDGQQDPTLDPPEYRWGFAESQEPIDQDADGKPIVTVHGESFDPPLTETVYTLMLSATKNVAVFNPIVAADYIGSVNTDTFLGVFPPGTALITQFEANSVTTNDLVYWRQTTGLQFRTGEPNTTNAKAWWRRVRAEGFLVTVDSVLGGGAKDNVRAVDKNGEPATKPVLHDKTTGEEILDPEDAQWYEWKTKKTRPFGAISLI